MRSWMLGALLCCTTAASAFIGNCDGTFSGEVQALYWRASHCPILYARAFVPEIGISGFRDDRIIFGDYDWGFRVGLGYERCCSSFGLSYLYVQTTDGARTNAPSGGQLAIQGSGSRVDFARASLKFRYQNVDFRAFRHLHQGCGCNFSVAAVARWVDIDMKYGTGGTLFDESAEDIHRALTQSSTFDGGGVGVGFAADYGLPCDLQLGGCFDFSALIGKRKMGKLVRLQSSDGPDLSIRSPVGATGFVPAGQFDLHLSYSRCVCRTQWGLRVGYEMHYFWDALRYAATDENEDGVPVSNCQSVGFGGPYIGLSASF
jgi:Legionella pneumophila major outer membrane protein precursor